MERVPALCRPEALQIFDTRDELKHLAIAPEELTVNAPGGDGQVRIFNCPDDYSIVLRAHRVGSLRQHFRVRRPQREQVDYLEAAETPVTGIAKAPADRRVELFGVGRRRVQHDEGHFTRGLAFPSPPEVVAVQLVLAKRSPLLQK